MPDFGGALDTLENVSTAGVATEAQLLDLEAQIEHQRVQQMELIARIAEHEQQTLDNQREMLRQMDNGASPAQAYNARSVSQSATFRAHRAGARGSSMSRSQEPSTEPHRSQEPNRSREPRRSAGGSSDGQHSARSGRTTLSENNAGTIVTLRASDNRPQDLEAGAGGIKQKQMSAAEQELALTEAALNQDQPQLNHVQLALRVIFMGLVGGALAFAIWVILGRAG